MRQDDFSSSPSSTTTPDPRRSSRVRAWTWPLVLAVLAISTSLALAVTVSAWLVPLYLVLMVWILAPLGGSREHAPASIEPGSEPACDSTSDLVLSSESAPTGTDFRSQADAASEGAAAAESAPETAQEVVNDPEPVVVKTRRGKGRGRKAKGGANVEPAAAATWIQVGPGKFVRVESPSTNENATAEPPLAEADAAASEGESVDLDASAPPAAEGAEEPLLPVDVHVSVPVHVPFQEQERAAEVGAEPENRLAIPEAPAPDDEPVPHGPTVDHALSTPDFDAVAEASPPLSPTSSWDEAAAWSDEEPVVGTFAVEVGSELAEDRPATPEAPAACDELEQDEPIVDDAPSSPASDVETEACRPGTSSAEVEPAQLDEEFVAAELAAEFGPESEDSVAIQGQPTSFDEPSSSQDEAFADADADTAFPSSHAVAEVPPQPSFAEEEVLPEPESVAWSVEEENAVQDEGLDVALEKEEARESDFRDLVTEFVPEPDDRLATVDASALGDDDSILDEEVAEADGDRLASDAEALLHASPEVVDSSEPDASSEAEWQPDGTWLNEDVCEDASVSSDDESVAEFEEESDGPEAEAASESASASLEWEDSRFGPVEPSGDQGIALDALGADWTTEPGDLPLEAASDARPSSLGLISSPSRSPGKASLDSGRRFRPRLGRALGRTTVSRSSGRGVRTGSKARGVSGVRRSRRDSGTPYRSACRTFPPRSPPVRGETGRLR